MKYTVTITTFPKDAQEELSQNQLQKLAIQELRKQNITIAEKDISDFVFNKKSLDARKGQIKIHYRYTVYTNGDKPETIEEGGEFSPSWQQVSSNSKQVLIIGDGPAGIFAALTLLEQGIKPIVLERGPETSQRKKDIADISRKGHVNLDSNYCFGEGGAGTFSDGKLYTRSNKRGNISRILQIFNYHGAIDEILTDAHPHIGTDKLPKIIQTMNETIVKFGGEVHFSTKVTKFITNKNGSGTACSNTASACSVAESACSDGGVSDSVAKATCSVGGVSDSVAKATCSVGGVSDSVAIATNSITGVSTTNTKTGETKDFLGDAIIVATGHSAPDIYENIYAISKEALEAKTFAVGVRVEHPREVIDRIQYHGVKRNGVLPAAEYRLTTQVDGRGVYSFCMCPGGLVVPSASNPDGIVINGMSPSSRDAIWSNAAIVVEVRPEDFINVENKNSVHHEISENSTQHEISESNNTLAGLFFRQKIEEYAKKAVVGNVAAKEAATTDIIVKKAVAGDCAEEICTDQATNITAQDNNEDSRNPQMAPAQRLVDFLDGKVSKDLPKTSYTPGVVSVNLNKVLPYHISSRLKKAFVEFNKNMKGFICNEALLIAPETRTSTPVRILRDKETFESSAVSGLFPAGEGSGYAGGIVSSAMDGENVATAIAKKLSTTK